MSLAIQSEALKACCIPRNPRSGREDDELRSLSAGGADSTQGSERRVAPLCAELLSALSSGRPIS